VRAALRRIFESFHVFSAEALADAVALPAWQRERPHAMKTTLIVSPHFEGGVVGAIRANAGDWTDDHFQLDRIPLDRLANEDRIGLRWRYLFAPITISDTSDNLDAGCEGTMQ
jgi:hypothetical protein